MKRWGYLVFLFFLSCKNETHQLQIKIEGFSSNEWQSDSLGCKGNRRELSHFLDDSIKKIIGIDKKELIYLLGAPNYSYHYIGDSMYSYFTAPGAQCYNKQWKEKNLTEAEQIIFFVNKKGIVRATTGVIYP